MNNCFDYRFSDWPTFARCPLMGTKADFSIVQMLFPIPNQHYCNEDNHSVTDRH